MEMTDMEKLEKIRDSIKEMNDLLEPIHHYAASWREEFFHLKESYKISIEVMEGALLIMKDLKNRIEILEGKTNESGV